MGQHRKPFNAPKLRAIQHVNVCEVDDAAVCPVPRFGSSGRGIVLAVVACVVMLGAPIAVIAIVASGSLL